MADDTRDPTTPDNPNNPTTDPNTPANDTAPPPAIRPDIEESIRSQKEVPSAYNEAQSEKNKDTAAGLAGGAVVGAGCLWYILLPLSFIILCMLIIWLFRVFASGGS